MSTKAPLRRAATTVAACAATVMLAGCSVGLDRVPLPSPSLGAQSFSVYAVFSNALNLPAKAKVRLHGADIGEIESITAQDFTARVAMRIRSDVPLPAASTAELRSATPLGDLFVQIQPPGGETSVLLRDGDTIALSSTAAAPTVEEVLNSMAVLINGGAIRNLTTDINGLGQAVGGRGQKLAALLAQTNDLLSRMSARSRQLDAALRSTTQLAADLAARHSTLDAALAAGAPAMAAISENASALADLAHNVARITGQLSRFPSLQGTDSRSLIADLNRLSASFNDISTDPDLSLTALNRVISVLIKATNSTALHGTLEVSQLALVPWPDVNYPGDPGFHGPDGTDWHQMIGSLRNIYGPGR